ncbi:unnamed protein product [Trichobilharzia regenti]|nr:unnamed protein product [Trichobilharzia regenti]
MRPADNWRFPESRVKHLITLYFNQLIHGCRNVDCQNQNCASSVRFAHPGITPNQAAALAIELTINRADLCLPANSSSVSSTGMNNSQPPTGQEDGNTEDSNGESMMDTNEPSQGVCNAQTSTDDGSPSNHLVASSGASTTGPEETEDSFPPLMTPAEVTRLIMFLFDASENDDLNSSQLNEPTSGIITDEYSADHDNTLSSAFRGRNPLFSSPRASSSDSDALKSIKQSANQTSPTVSTSNTPLERESRKAGLSLNELQRAVDMGKKNGDWSCLIILLNSVFSSYEALSRSFLDSDPDFDTKYTNYTKTTDASSNASLCITSAKKLKHDNDGGIIQQCSVDDNTTTANNNNDGLTDHITKSTGDTSVEPTVNRCTSDPVPMEQDSK